MGWATRVVDIFFESVRQLVMCGFNLELLLKHREFGIMNF